MLALLCAAFILGCGESWPEARLAPAEPATPAPAPTAKPVASHKPESTGSAGAQPAPSASIHASLPAQGATTPEELIFLSSIVARVRLLSAEAGVRNYLSNYRRDPVLAFRFRVIEYLKGSGDDELTVRVLAVNASTGHHYFQSASPSPTPNANEALRTAQTRLAERDTRWDGLEAVVFLRPSPLATESGVYEFTARTRATLDAYAITSAYTYIPNRAWLPGGVPSEKAAADSASDSSSPSEPRYFTSAPSVPSGAVATDAFIADSLSSDSPSAPSLSLSEIKSFIATHSDAQTKSKHVSGYEKCIREKFETDALYKEYPPEMTFSETRIPSGQPAGYKLWGDNPYMQNPAPHYNKWWFAGPDSDLFEYRITYDPDNDPTTGYAWEQFALRPVPEGEYKVFVKAQSSAWVPCGYNPEADLNRRDTTIIVTAPAAAIHEAFFDLASIGSGGAVGADASNGVLKPAGFTFGGGSVSLASIRWESQAAEIRLSPHTRLANHHADFIALDGSVALRLDFDDATETGEGDSRALSWDVCAQPWQAGDLLMLRISESPSDLIGATRDADCVSPTAVPATATPAPDTPTATPTVAPILDTPTPAPAG